MAQGRLLVADDEPSVLSTLTRYFQRQDYEAIATSTAQEAIGLLGAQRFDAVLAGLRLAGGGDGREVLRACREHDPTCPVIVITTFTTVAQAVEAMREGAFGFVEKPFDAADLEVLVHKALEHGRLQRTVVALQQELARRPAAAPAPAATHAATHALPGLPAELPEQGMQLKGLLDRLEDQFIDLALARTDGNRDKAARLLGLKRTTLVEKLKRRGDPGGDAPRYGGGAARRRPAR